MPVSDFLNPSDLISQPWNTIFSCFVDLLGTPFYLIPVSVIGAAIYIKQRNLAVVSMYLLTSAALLSSGSIFVGRSQPSKGNISINVCKIATCITSRAHIIF